MADIDKDTSPLEELEQTAQMQKESATGAIRKMFDDTRTRKVSPKALRRAETADAEPLSPMDDPLNVRNTDTGNLKRMLDSKQRKTVKLSPLSGENPAQSNAPTTPASSHRTVKLKSAAKPKSDEIEKLQNEAIAKSKAKATIRLGSIGNERPSETLTDKTVKIADTVDGASGATTGAVKLKPVSKKPASPTSGTIKLKPAATGAKGAPVVQLQPIKPTESSGTIKLKPAQSGAQPAKPAASGTKKIGSDTEAPADPLTRRDSNTGTMKKMLDDTKTRKTVKLKKEGQPVAASQAETEPSQDAAPKDAKAQTQVGAKPRSSQTQRFKARQTQKVKGVQRKKRVPGVHTAKDTIHLRAPSAAAAAAESTETTDVAGQKNAKQQTIRMAPVEVGSEASDTIKLTKKPKDPNKKPIPAKTAGVIKSPVGAATAKSVGSEILATDTVKSAVVSSDVKKAQVIQQAPLATDSAPRSGGLSIPKSGGRHPSAPTAPTQKLTIPEEEPRGPQRGGLKVAQQEAPKEAGPPMAKEGEEKFGKGKKHKKKAEAGDASIFYTVLAIASLILISAAAYISAAQYINLWEQNKIGHTLPVPFLDKTGQ